MVTRGGRSFEERVGQVLLDSEFLTTEQLEDAKQAVYGNRRRIKSGRGRALHRKRCELVERTFAHCLDTGGMRRVHLRGHENIEKRYLVHVAAYNLGLLMRTMIGFGTPRGLQGRVASAAEACRAILGVVRLLTRLFTIGIGSPTTRFSFWLVA